MAHDKPLVVKFTTEEKARLERLAAHEGLNLSACIRHLVARAAREIELAPEGR
jgi:hypothetical protein